MPSPTQVTITMEKDLHICLIKEKGLNKKGVWKKSQDEESSIRTRDENLREEQGKESMGMWTNKIRIIL